ncbi:IclR family transcriptional regulator [Kordiimonas pumila]|uniref:IclR family transcriptional regulator n=1 Tax=Kordiimonas pumila TaxID=2161677 RepID=A0ABV7D4J4_9PROT|nr:IclR family transcriptional regulator [Kordiimonas pumila]
MARRSSDSKIENRRGVQSVDIGVSILKAMAKANGPLPLKELSEAVGMASSNVHRYVSSFLQSGLLRQDPYTSHYDLGPLALDIGLSALSRTNIVEIATPEMKRLAHEHHVMVALTVYSVQGPTIVKLEQCSPPIITSIALGSLLPMRSATGRIFRAFLPEQVTKPAVDLEFKTRREKAAQKAILKTIESSLENLRKTRLSFIDVDVLPHLQAVASPILNFHGEASAVLSVTGENEKLDDPDHPALKDLLETTTALSYHLGFKDT